MDEKLRNSKATHLQRNLILTSESNYAVSLSLYLGNREKERGMIFSFSVGSSNQTSCSANQVLRRFL
jgi:hypothetical protein